MPRRARIWRLPVFLLSVMLATSAIVAVPVNAVGIGQFDQVSSNYYRDPNCGGTDAFVVDIWTDAQYQGTRFRFCSPYTDFCWVPYGQDSSSAAMCDTFGVDVPTANDRASSIKVVAVNGGSSCRVKVYEHADYGGVAWTSYVPTQDSDLGPVWPNDVFSSIKRVCG